MKKRRAEDVYGIYMPRYYRPKVLARVQNYFTKIFKENWDTFVSSYYSHPGLAEKYGDLTEYQIDTVEKFLNCNDLKQGFGVARCPNCGTAYIVPFSCKKHLICPSCRMKKLLEFSEWLEQEVLLDLAHRHWVLTLPLEIREYFRGNGHLQNKLIETGCRLMMHAYKKFAGVKWGDWKKIRPGVIGILQTFGGQLNYNPHCHLVTLDGILIERKGKEELFKSVTYINYRYLKIAWRERILRLLINYRKMNSNEAHWFRLKYSKGFMVNGQIKDTVNDYNIKHRLCQYMARGIISNRNILYYSRHKKEVIIQYKYDRKYHKRKFHIYDFMASILQHVDNITQHTRYYGAYSNVIRGRRRAEGKQANPKSKGIDRGEFKIKWRDLIWKIWEIDPLICVTCGTEMELKFLVDKESAKWELRRLRNLKYYYYGRWSDRSPPGFLAA